MASMSSSDPPSSPLPDGTTEPLRVPPGVREVREVVLRHPHPVVRHPGWSDRFPWLVQGTTHRGPDDAPFDLAVRGGEEEGSTGRRWSSLLEAEGMERLVRARQVHGAEVRLHRTGPAGVERAPAADGHVTDRTGVLVAVTVADCVPVFAVSERPRAVAVLHAGWRGTAAGVLEAGLDLLAAAVGADPVGLHLHLGPAICGRCYEVGPEVHRSLGLVAPLEPTPVDLRAVLAHRAVAAGVDSRRMTVSAWCTRCGGAPFFSHRGGDRQRQAGFAGLRPEAS